MPDASAIRVDPIDALLNPGFKLIDTRGTLRAENGDRTQSDFGFDVEVVAGEFRIKDNGLVVQIGPVFGTDGIDSSFVSVFETVLTLGANDLLGNKRVDCDAQTASPCANGTGTDLAEFDKVTGVTVIGGVDEVSVANDVAAIQSITMRFSQVPVPGSLALFSLGLGCLMLAARRRAPPTA